MNTNFVRLMPSRTRLAALKRLKKQHSVEPADYDLCTKVCDQYIDILNSTDGWRVCVCGLEVVEPCTSRLDAIRELENVFAR